MFMDLLREHRQGATHDELTEALRALTLAVGEERKAGTLTLKITIKPLGQGRRCGSVGGREARRHPTPAPGVSIFYPTPEGSLQRQDPRQQAMDLREIGPAEAHRGLA